ncbi:serine protease [Nocardiopsis sp. NPDC049922]|uniref:S1 family peptidase n=1 Tax=Nocardiopsis sp. NPDC049922 TaxID=3155157 RepID=UPI0033F664AE
MPTPHPPSGLQPNEPPWQMRMLDHADGVVGGAVLVSPSLLVTCAHVVNAALGRPGDPEEHPGPGTAVRLRSFDDRVWSADVLPELWSAGHGSRDLAVLRLSGPGLPDTDFPTMSGCADVSSEQVLYAVGYPAGMRSLQASVVYRGRGGPTDATHQVETPESRPAQITGGFSGCAVRTATGELVGIMQKNHHYLWNDPDQPSGIAFLLPVEEFVGDRDRREGVSVRRLADESLCGREAYARLHDLLDSVSVEEVPPEALLNAHELRTVRRRASGTTAWQVLTALWDLVPPVGEPPPRVAWVHHVYQEVRVRRPLPPMVWPWIRKEAYPLGRDWEEILSRHRDRRLLSHRKPDAFVGAAEPDTVVFFDLEPVTGGYRLSHKIAHVDEEVLLQSTKVVRESDILDEIGDLMGDTTMRRFVVPAEESLRLRVMLPKDLLHLNLGQAATHRELMEYPPRLGAMYEIVYHVRERVLFPGYMGALPTKWKRKTEQQRSDTLVRDRNSLLTWDFPVSEAVHLLDDGEVTVCVAESDDEDVRHIYDSALHQGIPTIVRGPRRAIRNLAEELLGLDPGSRVPISGLARYLRDRAKGDADSRDIALIQDDFGDDLPPQALREHDRPTP